MNLKISQNFNKRTVFYGFHPIHIAQVMNYRTLNSDADKEFVSLVSKTKNQCFFCEKKFLSLIVSFRSQSIRKNVKKKLPQISLFFGNSLHCVMWPEGTTSLSGRRSWNVRTVRNMYEQLRNGCSLSRKWLGHPERILMMLRGPLPVGPPDYRVGSGW